MRSTNAESLVSFFRGNSRKTLDLSGERFRSFPPWFGSLCRSNAQIDLDQVDENLLDVLAGTIDLCFQTSADALSSIIYLSTSPNLNTDDVPGFSRGEMSTSTSVEGTDDELDDEVAATGLLHARLAMALNDFKEDQRLGEILDPKAELERALERFMQWKGISLQTLQKSWRRTLTTGLNRSTRPLAQKLRDVGSVVLSNNDLEEFPQWLALLPKLTDLDLSDNGDLTVRQWPEIPFGTLEILDLSDTNLTVTTFPHAVFPRLRILAIAGCAGPGTLKVSLPGLEQLSASHLRGTENLTVTGRALRHLDLSGSHVVNIEDLVGVQSSLTHLDLSSLGLNRIPTLSADRAYEVDLSGNEFEEPNLEALSGSVSSLKRLNLSDCHIERLPDSISMFKALRVLDLGGNRLSSLNVELGRLPALTDVYLRENPLPELLLAAAGSGTEHLKRFLAELGNRPSTVREGKLLFVGEGTVGKSSLVAALRGEDFDEHRPTTHGIEIRRIQADTAHDTASRPDALIAWDFGGQEVYRVTHPFFFSQEAVYAVTWRPRDGVEQGGIFYWLEAIRHRVGLETALVVLVATHASEGRTTLLDLEDVQFRYHPAIRGYFSVDSDGGIGIPEFRERVLELVRELPLYGDPFPETWSQLRRDLPTIKRGFLLLGEYERFAAEYGLTPEAARSCARILHTLGDILYFDESDGLAAIVVIDPEVLARAVSYVLEDAEIKAAGGRLTLSQLRVLWERHDPELRDHPDMFSILIGLMGRFDIAYPVTEPDGTPGLLVAEMLPFRRPLDLPWETGDPPSGGQTELRVRYQFEARPSGLIPWLVVRNYRFITDHRWRTGVRFRHDMHDAECLVEESPKDLTVDVVCRGSYPLELFLSIKGDIDSILAARWPYLPRSAYIPCPSRWSAQCDGFFEYDYVVRALSKRRRVSECRKCLGEVQLHSLVSGLGRIPTSVEVLVDRLEYVANSVTDVRQVMGEVSSSLRFLRTEIAPGLHDTPTLFTLRPSVWSRGASVTPQVFRREFLLRLWCEFPEAPHPCGDPYRVRVRREWVTQMMPLIRATRAILRLVPVVKEALTMVGNDAVLDDVLESLDFVDAVSAQLGTTSSHAPAAKQAVQDSDGVEQNRQFDLRLLRELLHDVDPPPSRFAGLSRVVVPGRPVMWLCRVHAPQFSRIASL